MALFRCIAVVQSRHLLQVVLLGITGKHRLTEIASYFCITAAQKLLTLTPEYRAVSMAELECNRVNA